MGFIQELLPLIRGWEYNTIDIEEETLDPGEKKNIYYRPGEAGWMYAISAIINGANGGETVVKINSDNWQIDATLKELYNLGFTQRGSYLPYVFKYDDETQVYGMALDFAPLPAPHRRLFHFQLVAPESNSVKLSAIGMNIKIEDREKFVEDLNEVMGWSQ